MKAFLKTGVKILLFCLALILVNCEKDDNTNITEPKQELIFEKIYFNDLTQNNKLIQKLKKLKNNKSLYSRGDNDSILDFTVNDEVANYVEYANGNHSYSFSIHRTYETNTIENLLLVSNSNNEYNAFVVDYNISEEEYVNLENTSNLSSTISYQQIDYDFNNLRTELYDCSWEIVHIWVFNDETIYILELVCTPSGGESGSGSGPWGNNTDTDTDTDNDYHGPDSESGNNSNGGGSSNTGSSNNQTYTAPIITRDHAQEIIDCLGTLDFDIQLWLDDPDNFFAVRNINNYLNPSSGFGTNNDSCNLEAQAFAEEAIEAIMDETNDINNWEDFIANEIVENIDDTELDDCSKNILNDLKTLEQGKIAEIIKKLDSPNSPYSTDVSTSSNPSDFEPFAVGATNWNNTISGYIIPYDYFIKIQEDYTNTATKLGIAETLLHELVHAYFLSLIDDCFQANNCELLQTFPELWDYYVAYKNGGSLTDPISQHNAIANHYVLVLGEALQEYHTGEVVTSTNPLQQLYKDLAWGGLKETIPYNALSDEDKARIKGVNDAEDDNAPATNPSGIVIATPQGEPCN